MFFSEETNANGFQRGERATSDNIDPKSVCGRHTRFNEGKCEAPRGDLSFSTGDMDNFWQKADGMNRMCLQDSAEDIR